MENKDNILCELLIIRVSRYLLVKVPTTHLFICAMETARTFWYQRILLYNWLVGT